MKKRKRPKLKMGHLTSGEVYYFYRRPSTGNNTNSGIKVDVRPKKKKTEGQTPAE
jgi:hypothetical protein